MTRSSRRRAVRPLAVLVLIAAVLLFVSAAPRRSAAAAPGDTSASMNVIFILIDTLRADHLSAYGYERDTSPVLKTLAAAGVRFAQVRSQCSWTKASMASMWTGLYPARTGVLRFQHGLPPETTVPAEILKQAGYRTGGIWRNGWISHTFGFGQGFDLYVRPVPSRVAEKFERVNPSAHALEGSDLDATESALQFIRTFRNERFFLYVHYMDVHQYLYDRDSAKFGSGYADAYDNAIHWVDSNVGIVANALADEKLLDHTLLIVAADHGEAFAEHGREGHARDIYREVTEVPLIMMAPGHLPRGVVVDERVANVDIWPTILDLLGLPPMPNAQGRSLRPLITAASAQEPPSGGHARTIFSHIDQSWGRKEAEPRPLVAVEDGEYRLLRHTTNPARDELYDLKRDPREQTNVAPLQPDVVTRLAGQVDDYLRSAEAAPKPATEVELDAGELERLRALGYDVKQSAPAP